MKRRFRIFEIRPFTDPSVPRVTCSHYQSSCVQGKGESLLMVAYLWNSTGVVLLLVYFIRERERERSSLTFTWLFLLRCLHSRNWGLFRDSVPGVIHCSCVLSNWVGVSTRTLVLSWGKSWGPDTTVIHWSQWAFLEVHGPSSGIRNFGSSPPLSESNGSIDLQTYTLVIFSVGSKNWVTLQVDHD